MKKKVMCIILVISMVVMSACSSSDEITDSTTENSSNSTENKDASSNEISDDIENLPELTVHAMYNSEVQDFSEIVLQEVQRQAGVKLINTVASSATDQGQAWTLMISSPDTMPDIVTHSKLATIEKLGVDGGLIPLQDLIEEYGENIKMAFEEFPELKAASTAADGNIYQVASMKEWPVAQIPIIRQDWLDKLELKSPTNTDELYEVLYAFRYNDPNGNGEMDEVPFISRYTDTEGTNLLLSLFGTSVGLMPKDGEVVYDPQTPEFKEAVTELSKWYSEGLIDQEIFTRGQEARNTFFTDDRGGFIIDWTSSTLQYNDTLKETVPGFKMATLEPLINLRGEQVEYFKSIPTAGPAITVNCDDPVMAIKFIDFMYSPEGRMLNSFGIEGTTYEINSEGDPEFTSFMTENYNDITRARFENGMSARLGNIDPISLEYAIATNEDALKSYDKYATNIDSWYQEDEHVNYGFKYSKEEQQEISILLADLDAYVLETTISWILGQGDIEMEYDSFINELEVRDIDTVVDMSQAAYDRVKNK